MLATSPLSSTLEWDYPLDQIFDSYDLDNIAFPSNLSSSSQEENGDYIKPGDSSPRVTSSTDNYSDNNPVLIKKLCHNASERDRRKKINSMYSSLRALLPATDHRKKLSIPTTVSRVLEYIPQLQKEIEDLTQKMELLSSINLIQGNAGELLSQEENSSFSVSTNKLSDNEIVIHISTLFERISISEVLLHLEKNGYLVIDVSSFQTFGGWTFYNLHLWMEGSYGKINSDNLNEAFLLQIQRQKHLHM